MWVAPWRKPDGKVGRPTGKNVARHRVRDTTFATYRKPVRLIDAGLGAIAARQLRPEQVAAFISDLIDKGSASRARNVRTVLVQIMDQALGLGLAAYAPRDT